MANIEKVIKGLDVCTKKPCYCTDCPYKKDCLLDSQELMEDANELIKEQQRKIDALQGKIFNLTRALNYWMQKEREQSKGGNINMANLPTIADCPLRNDESQICMCMNLNCDGEVGTKECFAIRSAYQYGCAVTESKYLNEFKAICETVVNRMKELQKDSE